MKIEHTKTLYNEQEIHNISTSIKSLKHPSINNLIDLKQDKEFLQSFWEMSEGEQLLSDKLSKKEVDEGKSEEDKIQENNQENILSSEIINTGKTIENEKYKEEEPEFDSIGQSNKIFNPNNQKYTEEKMKEIMRETAQSLKHLHLVGLFHGNIDPYALTVSKSDHIKLGFMSINSNLKFAKLANRIHTSSNMVTVEKPGILKLKANMELLNKDISDVQKLFVDIAILNIYKNEQEIESIYSSEFKIFLDECKDGRFKDLNQILGM